MTRSRTKSGRIAAAYAQAKTPSPVFSTAEIILNDSKTGGELEAMVRSPSMNPSVDSIAVETPAHPPSPVQIRSGKKAVVPKIEDNDYDVPSVPHAILQNVPTSYPSSAHETVLPECEAAYKIDTIASLQPTKEEVIEHSDSALPSVSNPGADSQAAHVFPSAPLHPEVKPGGGVDSLATAIASFDDDPSFWDQVVAMEERRESGAQAEHSGPTRPGHPTIGSENAPTFNVSDADLQRKVWVNRGPVLSLWAAVVAQREGHRWQSAVTIGRAIASNFAASKAQKLGIQRSSKVDGEWEELPVFGTFVSAKKTEEGVCAVQNGRVISAQAAQSYLQNAFSVNLPFAQGAQLSSPFTSYMKREGYSLSAESDRVRHQQSWEGETKYVKHSEIVTRCMCASMYGLESL